MSSSSALTNDDDTYHSEGTADAVSAGRGCCFWLPCYGSASRSTVASFCGSIGWERIPGSESKEPWWERGGMKIREWSELIAGPKWKTFIRRFRKNGLFTNQTKTGKFQYDPLSYARNFDEGPGQNAILNSEDYLRRDFSMRYAAVPASAKSSIDLGNEGPPPAV